MLRYALRQLLVKTPAFHDHGVTDAGAGDRSECGDLHAGERGAAERPAGGRSEDAGAASGISNDCCVGFNGTPNDNGDYSLLFSPTPTSIFKKNAPEFEELAAMQAGFGYRPVIARRDGDAGRRRGP
jgi:hypothetical protein